MIHSYLLIGQSNMAGRGKTESVPPIINESIHVLRNGRWQMMAEPIHNDRPSAGVGLASSFAAAWQADHPAGEGIGLIPCADGGTSLDDWQPGGVLFDHAVLQTKLAQRSSRLSGILWHQGENDCAPELAAVYGRKFAPLIAELRKQLEAPDIPLFIGAIGDFLPNGIYGQHFQSYSLVNEALQEYARTHEHAYFVTAQDLTANEDQLHFNAESLRRFGLRYYEAFKTKADVLSPLADEEARLQSIYDRPLSKKEQAYRIELLFSSGKISMEAFQKEMGKLANP
ncbi:MAG: sialate O-acetylesterase [Mucilaginibacter polytrichastri]|nr:sialate O-acetylesterase [Mucilaginibacter polytrichastri]